MSKFEFKLPDIGEGVSEGEIVNWLVGVGDAVKEDQDMVEVMTDKATVTIGAPKAGKVAELKGEVGDVIPVGQVLVVLDISQDGEKAEAPAAAAAKPAAAPAAKPAATPAATPAAKPAAAPAAKASPAAAPAAKDSKESSPVFTLQDELPGVGAPSGGASNGYFNDKPLAAPATRKLARELDVDLRQVAPSGPNQRVTREDVESHARGGASSTAAAEPAAGTALARSAAPAPTAPLAPAPRVVDARGDQRIPIRGMRRRVFENMARSKRTAAHFTYFEECEVSALMAWRSRIKGYAEAEGVKLNFLPLIVKAVVASLRKNPTLNAIVDDEKGELVLKSTFDIGIAVATDNGLVVPVLRAADQLGLIQIAREIDRLSQEARDGKIRREDLGGSSFTITSLGKLGGSFATPVINYPEVAILYVPQIKQKPVVKDGQIVVGNVMNLGVSFDHRVIDGHTGASFVLNLAEFLQDPDRLLL